MFNDKMCIEYDSDSSENNDDGDELKEKNKGNEMQNDDE